MADTSSTRADRVNCFIQTLPKKIEPPRPAGRGGCLLAILSTFPALRLPAMLLAPNSRGKWHAR